MVPERWQEVKKVLGAAERLREGFSHSKVEPLYLLAAALREPCEGARILKEAGITEEKVLQILRSGGDLENGSFRLESQ